VTCIVDVKNNVKTGLQRSRCCLDEVWYGAPCRGGHKWKWTTQPTQYI